MKALLSPHYVWRHLRLGWLFFLQMIKARLEYRADFIIECLVAMLRQASGLMVVAVIFSNIPALKSWSREEVFFVYGFAMTAQALFESFADAFYRFSRRYIMGGEFDRILLRPLNPLWQILLENFNFEFLPDFILGVLILCISGYSLPQPPGASELLCLFIQLPSAILVLAGVFLSLASASFWLEDRMGLLPPFYNLLEFGRYPITIYNPTIRFLLTWILPYGFVAFYPASGLLGHDEYRAFFWSTPIAGMISMLIGVSFFKLGIKHYRSTGT